MSDLHIEYLKYCCIVFHTWYIHLKYLLYHIWYIHFPYICCKSIKYWVICKFPQYSQMLYWNVSNNNNVIPKVIIFLIAKDLPAKWVTAWRQPFCSPLLPTMHLHTHTHTHTHADISTLEVHSSWNRFHPKRKFSARKYTLDKARAKSH